MRFLLIDPDFLAREHLRRAVQAKLWGESVGVEDFSTAWMTLMEAEPPVDAFLADP